MWSWWRAATCSPSPETSADTQHFIHAHPLTALGQPIENGTLEFHITPKQAGLSKFFLQVNYQGREVIIPFARTTARGRPSTPAITKTRGTNTADGCATERA
jgi:hypothetical protein